MQPQPGYNQTQSYDTGISWRLGALVILALILVFVVQRLGFRFVVAAG